MSKAAAVSFEPRKTPLQARSTMSVEAILQATIQVLLSDGKSKLTTTRIAHRAGVSVGTLYQYFPNKSSVLQALLKDKLGNVALAVENACESAYGTTLAHMAESVATAFVQAKFRNVETSAALYAISDDLEGKRIARGMHTRITKAMTAMLQTASGRTIAEPALVTATLLSAMAGVSRATLEKGATRSSMAAMEQELVRLACAYLEAASSPCPG